MELKKERFIFMIKELWKQKFRLIECKKCGKKFNTEIVEENSNFTHDFKSKCLELVGLFFGSVRNIAYKVKKDTGVDISHQTIEKAEQRM